MNRGIIIALAFSLAANVFLGGFVAGKIAGGPHDHRRDRHHAFAELTPAARESLKRAFVEHRSDRAEARREADMLQRQLVETLGAETFDRTAADEIVAKFATLELRSRSDMARLVVEAADGLELDDRKALAKHLERRGFDRGKHRKGSRPGAKDGAPPPDGE